jgi:membrane-bound inhibitor of C-type lysozyme
VKTDVLKTTLAMDKGQISLPIGAQAFRSASGANYFAKELIVWSFDF